MKPLPVAEFARLVGGRAVGFQPEDKIVSFALDSSEARPGVLFVAIRGARVDGHDYVPPALALGAVGTLATRTVVGPHVLVESVEDALAAFARSFRDAFDGPVIGITGSAGKTTTKEFGAAALDALGPVLKSPGNRNTEFSAPLVWADLEPTHRAVVVEMAMRGFGQIRHLASFARPTIGVVTNIGLAHVEQVGSREGIARAKGELLEALPADGAGILWAGDEFLETLRGFAPCRVLTFGFEEGADCHVSRYAAISAERCAIEGTVLGSPYRAELATVGRHQALNAAAGLLAAVVAGAPAQDAAKRLVHAALPAMRMEAVPVGGATVLFDAYNASPSGVLAAIETLADLPCSGERVAVIGEMRELGDASEGAHREIGEALARAGVKRALFYGPLARGAQTGFELHGGHSAWTEEIEEVRAFLHALSAGDLALVKGSRALELERALEGLK